MTENEERRLEDGEYTIRTLPDGRKIVIGVTDREGVSDFPVDIALVDGEERRSLVAIDCYYLGRHREDGEAFDARTASASWEDRLRDGHPQLVIYDYDVDEAVAFAHITPEGTFVTFDYGVTDHAGRSVARAVYGLNTWRRPFEDRCPYVRVKNGVLVPFPAEVE